ncbi:helix-turn-helix domain-containing protein [Borreliella burgdorferi]
MIKRNAFNKSILYARFLYNKMLEDKIKYYKNPI